MRPVHAGPLPSAGVLVGMQLRVFLTGLVLLACCRAALAQPAYFPPTAPGAAWETTDPATLNWCPDRIDSLYAFLGANNTKAFLVLKDGRIVLERYFDSFTQESLWYWASAGKTLTGTVVGIAQAEGFLDINAASSTYLGSGWTNAASAQEQLISVRHQLTMTTGLDDGGDVNCTDPACLTYLADAGTRWAYHNAPYTLLQQVVANATGQAFNLYFNNRLRDPIGMDGFWVPLADNSVYLSTARSMARFGLLALNRMAWESDTLLQDPAFITAATTPSQALNPAYGYLWWLNGQSSFMLPQTQFVFPGPLLPDAPADLFSGLGMNNQLLNVVPGQGLVLVRMGNDPEGGSVSLLLNNGIWQYMNALECNTSIAGPEQAPQVVLTPNPASTAVHIAWPAGAAGTSVTLLDSQGRTVLQAHGAEMLDVQDLAPGLYLVHLFTGDKRFVSRLMKNSFNQ